MGIVVSSPAIGKVDDQIVVSVGPYMLISFPITSSPSSCARGADKASPPTIIAVNPRRARRDSRSATNRLAMDGVHCRCVTLWRAMRAGIVDCPFFFQAEDGIRVATVTGVQTCAIPI